MATWVKIHNAYLNKDAMNSIEPDPQDSTYLLAVLSDSRELKIGPFANPSAATTALAAIVASDTIVGPYT